MQKLMIILTVVFLASCQPRFSTAEDVLKNHIPGKLVSNSMNSFLANPAESDNKWYSDLSDLEGFENYEEENGLLLEGKLSIGIYSQPNHRKDKLIILEEIQNLKNGEVRFRKLDAVKIKLNRYQFLHTEFCNLKKDNNALVLTIYEGGDQISYAKNFIKAWQIDLQNFKLSLVSTKAINCEFKF